MIRYSAWSESFLYERLSLNEATGSLADLFALFIGRSTIKLKAQFTIIYADTFCTLQFL